ncbi:right-handed parallel beta-helix repeat-containing protein [Streptomyces thinghirensis]|nr:right-handed parallel beta-helix repeat-containing protein [Streptomyces thinghirensis]
MLGNHVAGFDVSAQGTTSVGGRGGIVTGCVIDGNAGDGIALGNTPGPYAFRGNRVSANGRYGYWQHNLAGGDQEPATDIVLESNDIHDNALDGIRVDARCTSRRSSATGSGTTAAAPRRRPGGGGAGVHCGPLSLTDENADWLPGGHRGKRLTVGAWNAGAGPRDADAEAGARVTAGAGAEVTVVVTDNTATELTLAPERPGAQTAWPGGTPGPGAAYRLPDAPTPRTGLTAAAAVTHPYVHGNRVRDDEAPAHPDARPVDRARGHLDRRPGLRQRLQRQRVGGDPLRLGAERRSLAGQRRLTRRLTVPAARPSPRSGPPCRSPRPPPGARPRCGRYG